jgi:RNA polymerase sigma-B factor
MPTDSSSPSEAWLLARYKRRGDTDAREALVQRMLPLVRQMARTFGSREDGDDLEQVAALALVKAIDRYDPGHGVPLRAYAVPTMSGELRHYLRDHAWSLHVPRGLQERVLAITKATERLSARSGRSPTARELAAEMECTLEDVLEGLQAGNAYAATSLEAPLGRDEASDHTVADLFVVEEAGFDRVEQAASLRSLRDVLDDRDRTVLHLRYVEELTQRAIGERIGVSQMQVSRILRRSLKRLHAVLGPDDATIRASA